ncbi:hypothetical protein B296_00009788 [Ensete ventricosum]|uniref:FLZ-type domain-containing protein n=1 Tax=Ensete ventricosum TaxID=4639 RepID=A0A426YRB7_ENSVE|nr:hypothetical protein B296_00009788 [Ensete ventricosum]
MPEIGEEGRGTGGVMFSPRPRFFVEEGYDEARHFLDSCFLCKRPLAGNRDIFMYRFGATTRFCSSNMSSLLAYYHHDCMVWFMKNCYGGDEQRRHTILQRGVPARADRDGRGQGTEVEAFFKEFFVKGAAERIKNQRDHQPTEVPEDPCQSRYRSCRLIVLSSDQTSSN